MESQKFKIQELISIGYVFLLICGISREVIKYAFLDFNIVKYSDVLDILLSPIKFIAEDLWVIGMIVFIILFFSWISKRRSKGNEDEKNKIFNGGMVILLFFIASFYLGTGIGEGFKTKRKIKAGDYKLTHKLEYQDGKKESVHVLGQNSNYIFYLTKKEKNISIAPISGNIRLIKKLK